MKSLYRHSIGAVFRRQGVSGLLRWCGRWAATPLSSALGRPIGPPVLATLLVTYRCNAACAMCDFRKRVRGEVVEFGEREMKEILDGLSGLGAGAVGFTGGEPLLRSDLVTLLSHSVDLGLITHLNTNGLLVDKDKAESLLETGIHSVNVSIDYQDGERHDAARGTRGLFDAAVNALKIFANARNRVASQARILAVASVASDNIAEITDLAASCTGWGADALGLIPRHERVEPGSTPLREPDPGTWRTWEKEVLPRLLVLQRNGTIDNSASYLKMFKLFFNGGRLPFRCLAGYNSITVDCYGDVYPCFPFAGAGYGGMRLPETEKSATPGGRFRSLWKSPVYGAIRKETENCGGCFWNCQTELNLLHHPLYIARSTAGMPARENRHSRRCGPGLPGS